ncbi:GTP cyclohydrolase II RibA [Blastochloris viridis]|uniref:GTP cyclohydrolase II n=1 Tax=Blastochloris viridis TaxID=1079 RepID=A0A0H5BAM6_BLAVI|nr:GTP cyclohydrolase II RibA [Blastochloris viridis]ALK10796.1 GTP cyclohydrolase-2 [Blastochloris viridis]BAR99235.1 3,4-dihydroxy-2-butanone 4-phosphate synthase [Blastochloris viridis]CUU43458.1 GTP cyclohydrolase-2 [Blastochloris viridis]
MRLQHEHVAVERALAEIRAGRPVTIMDGAAAVLAVAAEGLDATLAAEFGALAAGTARLVLPAARLRRLGLERARPGVVALPRLDPARIERLTLALDATIDAPVSPAVPLDDVALELARLALVLPAMVLAEVAAPDAGVLRVAASAIAAYRAGEVQRLRIVGRGPVPLAGAPDSEFVVFRGGEGLRDQVAVVVGRPDLAGVVPVRLHSACLTGDLFGSLACDCGDQLRDTARRMAAGAGGIILYLDHEGRGTGIANKMRAYQLQSQGFDTFDADEALGFDPDGRRFDFAAAMLRQLGVTKVRLLTNNPVKTDALRTAGLEVVAEERVFGRQTAANLRYLSAKRDRAGHAIDIKPPPDQA